MSTGEMVVRLPPALSEAEAKLLLAIKLYEVGRASLGQAAGEAEMLGRHQIPVFDYSPEELRQKVGL